MGYFQVLIEGVLAMVILSICAMAMGYIMEGDIFYRDGIFFSVMAIVVVVTTLYRLYDTHKRLAHRQHAEVEQWERDLRKKEANKRKRKKRK
jgi:uncharacterized membrane protein